ncbi:MAG: hypothetical protein Q7U96_01760 [Chloroflexota bacterium]|nr:hypothetical protein [Chloroflexota bacterium]
MGDEFNPLDYVIRMRGQRDYLEVKYRVLWLRREHPTARIRSECLTHTENFALFRVTIDLGEKGSAEGHGSESRDSFVSFIEKAETRALGNALDNLGFSTDAAFLAAGQKPPLDERPQGGGRRDRESAPSASAAAPPPKPDYDGFWREVRAMGFLPQEVLGLFGVRDLRGVSLDEAMVRLRDLKEKKDRGEAPAQPAPAPAPAAVEHDEPPSGISASQ